MLTVIIKDNGEPNVVQYTYEQLWKELKDIPEAQLLVKERWLEGIEKIKNKYVCLVEPDCLVSSGFFWSQLGLFQKNKMFRKLSMLSSSTGVNNWVNKFYGYTLVDEHTTGVMPIREKKSRAVYPVQVGFVPGAIIRVSMLKDVLKEMKPMLGWEDDLVYLSTALSLAFWRQGDGNPVHVNPNSTYVTTEDYVNDIGKFDPEAEDLKPMFAKESI